MKILVVCYMPCQCWKQGVVKCRDNFNVKFSLQEMCQIGICRKSGCQMLWSIINCDHIVVGPL